MFSNASIVNLLILLAACACKSEPASTLQDSFDPQKYEFEYPLGVGYSSLLNTGLGRWSQGQVYSPFLCVQGKDTKVYRPYGEITSSYERTEGQDIGTATLTGNASANWSGLKISGSAEYEKTLFSNRLKISELTRIRLRAGNVMLSDVLITGMAEALPTSTPFDRLEKCGDEYVYQVELGASLIVGFEYLFADAGMRDTFKANFKVKQDETGATLATLNLPKKKITKGDAIGLMRIVFYQSGGNKTRFKEIQQELTSKDCFLKAEAKVGNNIEISGHQSCIDAYRNKVLPYAMNEFLQTNADLKHDAESGDGWAPIQYFTKRYDNDGAYAFQEEYVVHPQIKALISQVNNFIREYRKARNLIYTLADIGDTIGNEQNAVSVDLFGIEMKPRIQAAKDGSKDAKVAIRKIEDDVMSCITGILEASAKVQLEGTLNSAATTCKTAIGKSKETLKSLADVLKVDNDTRKVLVGE